MVDVSTARSPFSLGGPLPSHPIVIEASAGTGKTYTISALATRYVIGDPGDPEAPLGGGIPVDELLVVTFTRAAAAELRDRIRAMFVVATDAVGGDIDDDAAEWLQQLAARSPSDRAEISARLDRAIRQFDESTITTIHGFCQQALRQVGMAAGDGSAILVEDDRRLVAEVCRDVLVAELADDPYAMSTDSDSREIEWGADGTVAKRAANRQPSLPRKIEGDFINAVATVRRNADAVVVPSTSIGGVAGRWSKLVATALAEIDQRQRRRREIGFDRLVGDLRDALAAGDAGSRLAAQLAERYTVVLVDEFQDTDAQQWQIFHRAFGAQRLVVVGDPKQAIYRFRGADVHAYLDAVAALPTSTLATNFRSDAALLAALDQMWNGAELGDRRILFSPVAPRPDAPQSALREAPGHTTTAAIHLRTVPNRPDLIGSKGAMLTMPAADLILDDLGRRITELLDHGEIERDGSWHPVTPADIAILVPSQARASWCAATLRTWDIPTVRARTGSVLESDAALQWRILLAAIAQPANKRRARAAARSWAFDLPAAEIVGDGDDDDDMVAGVQQRLAELAHLLRHRGVGALYEAVRRSDDDGRIVSVTAALRGADGDRHMADLDHVADLLIGELHGASTEPLAVQQALEQLTADADLGGEATMRRIETDREAVQITTIHAAKGLEFPIVMMPFASAARPNTMRPYVYNVGSERHVDVGSWVNWVDDDNRTLNDRKAQATDELAGDGLRTLYVAMTRARHRLEMWWAPTDRSATSSLARLLFDREGDRLLNSPHGTFSRRGGDDGRDACMALAAASNGLIAHFDVVDSGPPAQLQLPLDAEAVDAPKLADHGGRVVADATWRTWSFTSLTRAAVAGETAVVHGPAHAAAPIVGGGNDEPPTTLDGAIPTKLGPLSDVVGGTAFGTLVHQVLEVVEFTSATLDVDVGAAIDEESVRVGLDLGDQREAVRDGVVAALHTPLGPLFDDRRLVDLDAGDRLAEATFDFELPAPVSAADFGAALTDTLTSDDPLHDYGHQLAETFGGVDLRGWLTGSIDGVFRIGGRYFVVDYKTNRLQGYDQAALVEAMVHSNYPLQALLYSVGLHRFLRWRLAGYDPEAHLGGIGYLFLRGMVGAETPSTGGAVDGVFAWRPPVATIESLDEVLRGATR